MTEKMNERYLRNAVNFELEKIRKDLILLKDLILNTRERVERLEEQDKREERDMIKDAVAITMPIVLMSRMMASKGPRKIDLDKISLGLDDLEEEEEERLTPPLKKRLDALRKSSKEDWEKLKEAYKN